MDSNGDSKVDGSDTTVNLVSGLIIIPMLRPFEPLGDEIIYQMENDSYSINPLDTELFIAAKGKIGRDAVDLQQGNILKGSVRVKVNGNELKENLDYIVDYDFGRITFLTPAGKDPDAKIEIDYEFRGMFDVASKSLAGVRMDWNLTDYAKLGGTFIYRSENVADKRPRIGNENIEMMLANLDGNITVKPKFITRWMDWLPFISTTAESRLTLFWRDSIHPAKHLRRSGRQKELHLFGRYGIDHGFLSAACDDLFLGERQ
jgi:cell surface protein SprA